MGRVKGERFEIVTLKSGARAIRELASGEVMHPAVGPWAEAKALYVDQLKLREKLSESPLPSGEGQGEGAKSSTEPASFSLRDPVVIFDIGLGGAANAAAALSCANDCGPAKRRPICLVSFEIDTEPLELCLEDPEGFPFLVPLAEPLRKLLATGAWEGEGVTWTLHRGDALVALAKVTDRAELIFHDPFSPETNTSMWTPEAFAALRAHARDDARGCVLATYSASTRTRASMLLGGWCVGVGDPTGFKKETTVAATRPELLARPLDQRWLQRWRRSDARTAWGRDTVSPDDEARITAALG